MRTLKTFVVASGFHELAVAAPSMKAALAAWGMTHNAFHQGIAKAVTDAAIVRAAEAHPGVVLKRPIGSKGAFKLVPDAIQPPTPPKGTKPKPKQADPKKIRAAQQALDKAQADYRRRAGALEAQISALEERRDAETMAWDTARAKLNDNLARAKKA